MSVARNLKNKLPGLLKESDFWEDLMDVFEEELNRLQDVIFVDKYYLYPFSYNEVEDIVEVAKDFGFDINSEIKTDLDYAQACMKAISFFIKNQGITYAYEFLFRLLEKNGTIYLCSQNSSQKLIKKVNWPSTIENAPLDRKNIPSFFNHTYFESGDNPTQNLVIEYKSKDLITFSDISVPFNNFLTSSNERLAIKLKLDSIDPVSNGFLEEVNSKYISFSGNDIIDFESLFGKSAVKFDGNTKICSDILVSSEYSDFTSYNISFNLKIDSSLNNTATIISCFDGSENIKQQIFLVPSDGKFELYFMLGEYPFYEIGESTTGILLDTEVEYFISFNLFLNKNYTPTPFPKKTLVEVFVNNYLKYSYDPAANAAKKLPVQSLQLNIGNYSFSDSTRNFKGLISNMSIQGKFLSQEEISQNFVGSLGIYDERFFRYIEDNVFNFKKASTAPMIGAAISLYSDVNAYYDTISELSSLSNLRYSYPDILTNACATKFFRVRPLIDPMFFDNDPDQPFDDTIRFRFDSILEGTVLPISQLFKTVKIGSGFKGMYPKDYPLLDKDLIFYLPLSNGNLQIDNTYKLYDESTNEYPVVLSGSYIPSCGTIGKALHFSGTTKVYADNVFMSASSKTINVWVKNIEDTGYVVDIFSSKDVLMINDFGLSIDSGTVYATINKKKYATVPIQIDETLMVTLIYDHDNRKIVSYRNGAYWREGTISYPSTLDEVSAGVIATLTGTADRELEENELAGKDLIFKDLTRGLQLVSISSHSVTDVSLIIPSITYTIPSKEITGIEANSEYNIVDYYPTPNISGSTAENDVYGSSCDLAITAPRNILEDEFVGKIIKWEDDVYGWQVAEIISNNAVLSGDDFTVTFEDREMGFVGLGNDFFIYDFLPYDTALLEFNTSHPFGVNLSENLNAIVEEARLYNRILSEEEISLLFSTRIGTSKSIACPVFYRPIEIEEYYEDTSAKIKGLSCPIVANRCIEEIGYADATSSYTGSGIVQHLSMIPGGLKLRIRNASGDIVEVDDDPITGEFVYELETIGTANYSTNTIFVDFSSNANIQAESLIEIDYKTTAAIEYTEAGIFDENDQCVAYTTFAPIRFNNYRNHLSLDWMFYDDFVTE